MELPSEIQTGEISFYKTRDRGRIFPEYKRYGFINWPNHDNLYFPFRENKNFLEGKEAEDVEHHEVRFYARTDRDDRLFAEIVEIIGEYHPTAESTTNSAP